MTDVDWRQLSGPHVSRRTLLQIAAATGALGYAGRLARVDAAARLPAARQEPKQGGTLNFGFGLGEILTLDPSQVTQGVVAGVVLPNLYSSLVQFDAELGIIPDLAETWEVTEDGLQYTFHLRPGLTFHNGDPLTAEDFVYTHQHTTDSALASPHANKLALITEITAPDELTLLITQSEPYAPFLATACSRGPGRALTPLPRSAIEEMGNDQFALTPVGSGPFMLVPESVEIGQGFEMVAFDGWYGGRPLLDQVNIKLIPEASSMVSGIEAGDVDMLDLVPAVGVEQLRQNDDITIVDAPGTNWQGLVLNGQQAPWDNPDARMAISKAINRPEFVEKAYFGLMVASVGPIAPAFGWVYRPPEEVENPQDFDLDAAKELAQAAGLDGLEPVFIVNAADPRPAQVLRPMLQEIGIDPRIEQLQEAAFRERWDARDYDMFIHGSVVDADPDDGTWHFFHSQGPRNFASYSNPRADELLDGQRQTASQEERARLFQELQTLLEEDAPYAFLFHEPDRTAFYTYVQGYVPIPEQRYLEHVWLDQ